VRGLVVGCNTQTASWVISVQFRPKKMTWRLPLQQQLSKLLKLDLFLRVVELLQ
jgi:hypothetical protein